MVVVGQEKRGHILLVVVARDVRLDGRSQASSLSYPPNNKKKANESNNLV